MEQVQNILSRAKNIAIIGLSPNPTKDSHIVGKYLQSRGYNVIPVYPKGEYILDSKVYKSLTDALENHAIDIIVVFRKNEFVGTITQEIIDYMDSSPKHAPKILWLQLGITSERATNALVPYNIKVVQDACIKIEHAKMNA